MANSTRNRTAAPQGSTIRERVFSIMSSHRMNGSSQRSSWRALRPIGLLAALAACQTAPTPAPAPEATTASSPARPLVVDSVPAFTPSVVRLESRFRDAPLEGGTRGRQC